MDYEQLPWDLNYVLKYLHRPCVVTVCIGPVFIMTEIARWLLVVWFSSGLLKLWTMSSFHGKFSCTVLVVVLQSA